MDFALSPRAAELSDRLNAFMDSHVYPAEAVYAEQMEASGDPSFHPQIVEDLKAEARSQGLWNLFLPSEEWGAGLSVLDYAPLAEITGRSPHLAPEALNCAAPDTGNMEILEMFGTPQQHERWLRPLLDGEIRSAFSMTEPDVASSDARNIRTQIRPDGDDYVISGNKWWSSGAFSPRCKVTIVMGVTNPDANPYQQQSMVLVPLDTPGVTVERDLTVFGYRDRGGHPMIRFDEVRVPKTNLLGDEGSGFAIAQARLGPGRIHHCMRALGMAERAFDMMCSRAKARETFGSPIAEHGVVQDWIAEARIQIEQARLLVLKTAWLIDTVGVKGARIEISAIKVAVPRLAVWVVDRAMQTFGAGGLSGDYPLAGFYGHLRTLMIADGPDEVHKRSVARRELGRYEPGFAPESYPYQPWS
ncbi:MAG: acyl-CoA dehydrogenase family protein [Acidimicrobiia bacterium]|nr:acyl-CoA dehydrogenase family protein [Acidimicrobiia bacterium]